MCPGGGFALSASALPCIDSWTKGMVPRITQSIRPHPPPLLTLSIFHQTLLQSGEVKQEVVREGVSVFKIPKSCAMNPDSCLGGFISSCVSPCLDDRRKMFMRLQMLKFDNKISLPACVTLNYPGIPSD